MAQGKRKRLHPSKYLYVCQLVVGQDRRWYTTVVREVNLLEGSHCCLFWLQYNQCTWHMQAVQMTGTNCRQTFSNERPENKQIFNLKQKTTSENTS